MSSRLSISHISHPHPFPNQYQPTGGPPSPDSAHSNNGSILEPMPDQSGLSGGYFNSHPHIISGTYNQSISMPQQGMNARYDSPPPILAPIQDERVIRGDPRVSHMHHSSVPNLSSPQSNMSSYMSHSHIPNSYPYHSPHLSLGQTNWRSDGGLRVKSSTSFV
ncbi:hypothetical protein SERLADRAFT_462535 [Serpula lacrymans var. lacrymans S7.9]|uniref:Uncharacterized protein n=1 Tax=Serpula lacrymans var. lacrymans (strain S7.9) TaxID=578457 RepID=F8NNX2_SERL9|nr:uncharacterized protein SERLADRAFT_462535 [Serpula lacrymans var. lacrymans S7.9]EGO28072.1 hypothetical protein SERLADRAFT_462535 [Serpula lacrymans var. lacrymans S7.9]